MALFSKRLRELRLQDNQTQEEAAAAIGVSRSAFSMWEQGKREPSFVQLEKIADYYNVSTASLMGWDEKQLEDFRFTIETKSVYNAVLSYYEQLNDLDLDDSQMRDVLAYAKFIKNKKQFG